MIQSGRLFLPERAHWRAEYASELLGFPSARHDDQVDATSQLLAWVQKKDMWRAPVNAGPEEIFDTGASALPPDYDDFDPWSGN